MTPPGPGPTMGLTQGQPRTPGGSLGGNALSGFWYLLPAQKVPPAGSVPTRLASRNHGRLERQPLSLLRRQLPLHRGAFGHGKGMGPKQRLASLRQGRLDGQSLRLVGADCVSLALPLRDGASLAHAVAPPLPTKPACAGLWRGPHHAGPPPFAQGRLWSVSV